MPTATAALRLPRLPLLYRLLAAASILNGTGRIHGRRGNRPVCLGQPAGRAIQTTTMPRTLREHLHPQPALAALQLELDGLRLALLACTAVGLTAAAAVVVEAAYLVAGRLVFEEKEKEKEEGEA